MGFSNSDFEKRVDQINWSDYSTAYGNACVVAKQLKELASTNPKLAMAASHDLWCGLCHQHAYISSAALPAFPLLIDVLKSTDEKLKVEILDIITGIAALKQRENLCALPKTAFSTKTRLAFSRVDYRKPLCQTRTSGDGRTSGA